MNIVNAIRPFVILRFAILAITTIALLAPASTVAAETHRAISSSATLLDAKPAVDVAILSKAVARTLGDTRAGEEKYSGGIDLDPLPPPAMATNATALSAGNFNSETLASHNFAAGDPSRGPRAPPR